MTTHDDIAKRMQRLADEVCPHESIADAVVDRLSERGNTPNRTLPYGSRLATWPSLQWAPVALAATVVFLAVLLGPFRISSQDGGDWLTSTSTAYGQVLTDALEKAVVKGVTFRETTVIVMSDGKHHTSSTVGKQFIARDRYRRDQYEGERLHSRQWYVPNNGGMVQTGLAYDTKTYTVLRHEGSFGDTDPIARLKFFVNLVDKADKRLANRKIDGVDCIGFEISASKYGDNPEDWKDRIWFDAETKLPVRMERERPRKETQFEAFIRVQDDFNWQPELPEDAFLPKIPEGFEQVER